MKKDCKNCDWLKYLEANYYCTEPETINKRGLDYLNLKLCNKWKNDKLLLNKKLQKIKNATI